MIRMATFKGHRQTTIIKQRYCKDPATWENTRVFDVRPWLVRAALWRQAQSATRRVSPARSLATKSVRVCVCARNSVRRHFSTQNVAKRDTRFVCRVRARLRRVPAKSKNANRSPRASERSRRRNESDREPKSLNKSKRVYSLGKWN